ncbi:MAG: hypothetical protein WKF75_15780 [Singulisphaera sp.]
MAVVRAVDRGAGGEVEEGHLETWAYDPGRNTWSRMNPPHEPEGWHNRRRIMVAVPDHNLILMGYCVNPEAGVPGARREQQIWTYRYAIPGPAAGPAPPAEVGVTTTVDGATVEWRPVASDDVAGFVIERRGKKPKLSGPHVGQGRS